MALPTPDETRTASAMRLIGDAAMPCHAAATHPTNAASSIPGSLFAKLVAINLGLPLPLSPNSPSLRS